MRSLRPFRPMWTTPSADVLLRPTALRFVKADSGNDGASECPAYPRCGAAA
jgi:hypothetical protein